jgi:RND family efflux transporter MFP subunit
VASAFPGLNMAHRSVILLCLFLALACSNAAGVPVAAAPVRVHLVPVAHRDVSEPIRLVGTMQHATETTLAFPFGGIVASVAVNAGDTVHRGQQLASLDPVVSKTQLAQAEAALAKAQRDFGRAKTLEGTVLTPAQREDAQTGLDVANANVAAARFQVQRSALIAPSDGIVLRRNIDPDETVGPGMPALWLGAEGYELQGTVTAPERVRLHVGDTATATVDAWPGVDFTASVVRIDGAADPRTGLFPVTLRVDPKDHELSSGFIGAVTISPIATPATLVPLTAVAQANGATAIVYTVTGTAARRVPITVGRILGDEVIVISGLEGIDSVVTDGAAYLTDGAAAKVE